MKGDVGEFIICFSLSLPFACSGENVGTGSLLFLASDDAVGAMSVEVRVRTGRSAAVPFNVPPREVFDPVLLVLEATLSDDTPAAETVLLLLILLDDPGAVNAGI